MFGYIMVNKPEMKFREFDMYRSYYCGLCRVLKDRFGAAGQMTLSYDMTFLVLLLSGLYEPDIVEESCKCIVHPLEKHPVRKNEITDYVADMDILLSYYKCMDDWYDDKNAAKYAYAGVLKKKFREVEKKYPEKSDRIAELLGKIREAETMQDMNLDTASGLFGEIMAELFVLRKDEWEESLRKMGFYLGKFVYLMDAYDDLKKDIERKNYNPFLDKYQDEGFEEMVKQILTMMMAECSKAFERLPILRDVEILRNILYAGVWNRYEAVFAERMKHAEGEKK